MRALPVTTRPRCSIRLGQTSVHADIIKNVYDHSKGSGKKEEVGTVLYNRGMINAMVTIEAIRTAQAKYGKKPLTGEQVRWGHREPESRPGEAAPASDSAA